MPLSIKNSTASLRNQSLIGRNERQSTRSVAKLASGLRLYSAKEDAAALGVAENLQAEHMSARAAMRNINDGLSVIRTAEGAATDVIEMVKRMFELSRAAASEVLNGTERRYLDREYTSLEKEIDRVALSTEFNGVQITNATQTVEVQVGINNSSDDTVEIRLGDLRVKNLLVNGASNLTSATNAQTAFAVLDKALDQLNRQRSAYGAVSSQLESALANIENMSLNTGSAISRIQDLDYAKESTAVARQQILKNAGLAVHAQRKAMGSDLLSLL